MQEKWFITSECQKNQTCNITLQQGWSTLCSFSNTCTIPHFLPDPIMKQSFKSCANILQSSDHVLCEGELFTPPVSGMWEGEGGGAKDDVWSGRTSFPSELIRTDKLTQWAAERLGERRAREAGVEVGGGRQQSLDVEHLRGFSWLLLFSPHVSCLSNENTDDRNRETAKRYSTCVWNILHMHGRQIGSNSSASSVWGLHMHAWPFFKAAVVVC